MKTYREQGYILLTTAIIVGSIGLLTASSVLFFANGFTKNNRALSNSNKAKALTNACAELAIQRLIATPTYTGTTSATISGNSCSYTITNTSTTALATTTATVGGVVRKTQINFTLNPLTVSQWQEVP